MKKHPLLETLTNETPEKGHFSLCHLGQHSFLLRTEHHLIAFDPYLTADANRRIAPFLRPEELTDVDVILGSHDHGDHIDRPALADMAVASPQAVFVFPQAVIPSIREIPPSRMRGLNDGGVLNLDGVCIHGIAAAHEFLDRDPATGLYPYLGFVTECDGVTVYHAGDCCIYEGLQTKLAKWHCDLLLLPINGRDARRLRSNCIGNMTYQEAADLAGNLRAEHVMPAHYDMFEGNTEDPELFLDYMAIKYPDMRAELPPTGKIIRY